jgi:hypothetical protein
MHRSKRTSAADAGAGILHRSAAEYKINLDDDG